MADQKLRPKKCLFPVAGFGTRFLPATKAMPKEMLTVVDKPLVQYGVEDADEAGMTEIAFVTGRGKRAIEDHFDRSLELHLIGMEEDKVRKRLELLENLMNRCTFSYTRQRDIAGLGHAILTGETLIGNEPFGVILADDLCDGAGSGSVMLQLKRVFERYQCTVFAIEEVNQNEVSQYGIVDAEVLEGEPRTFNVKGLIEKPLPSEAPPSPVDKNKYLAIIGRYILTPTIFTHLRKTRHGAKNEIQLTDAINSLVKEGGKANRVLAYHFEGKRYDCGSVEGFVLATIDFHAKKKNEENA